MGNFVSYYNEQGVIPVRQDLKKMREHINRRRGLYLQLGIAPALIRGSQVIEFGPGSADNARVTAMFEPQFYQLVEGSESGYQYIDKRLKSKEFHGNQNISLKQSLIQSYEDDKQYDLVLCEGLLPGQDEPEQILRKVSQFVRPGGVLVITTATYVSLLSEIMRRNLLPYFHFSNEAEMLPRLCRFFEKHLRHLKFVSRLTEDWVMDSILHPWGHNYQFSIAEAAEVLVDEFEYLGSSPTFYQDWSWYKEKVENNNGSLRGLQEQYLRQELSFIDNKQLANVVDSSMGEALVDKIKELYFVHRQFVDGDHAMQSNMTALLQKIYQHLDSLGLETSNAVKDYLDALDTMKENKLEPEQVEFGRFESFWGRGQQYLSVVKVDEQGEYDV